MKRYSLASFSFLYSLAIVMIVSGCAAVQPFPMAARSGDTIIMAVGSADGMTTSNTSATYTAHAGGAPVPLTIRSVFNLYPEKSSRAWLNSSASVVEGDTGHGPWTTMVAADLPTGLSPGTGDIQITTTATFPPPPARDINTTLLPFEILPGTGVSNPFSYEIAAGLPLTGDLTQLEPDRRIVIKPVYTGAASTTYGAIEVRIDIPILSSVTLTDYSVIVDEKIRHYQENNRANCLWSQQGSEIVVSFISPTGGLDYSQVYFSVLSDTIMSLIDASLITVSSLTPVVTYYDLNGNMVPVTDSFVLIDET